MRTALVPEPFAPISTIITGSTTCYRIINFALPGTPHSSFALALRAPFLRSRETSTHSLQSAGKLRILLLDLELGSGGLGVGECVDDLALGSRQLSGTLKVLQGLVDLALLEEELGHGGNSDIALWVDCSLLVL